MIGLFISIASLLILAIGFWVACARAPLCDENERVIRSNVIDLAKYRRRRAA